MNKFIKIILIILILLFGVLALAVNTLKINNVQIGEQGELITMEILRAKYKLLL